MSVNIDIDRLNEHDRRDATADLDVLIKLFDSNLRILKAIKTDSDRYMAGRIEELESTIRTLESLRNIASMSNRQNASFDSPRGMSGLWTPRQARTSTRLEDCTRTKHIRRHS